MAERLTPRTKDGQRLDLTVATWPRLQRNRWTRVTDLKTGLDYEVKKAACGLDCYCDALARLAPATRGQNAAALAFERLGERLAARRAK